MVEEQGADLLDLRTILSAAAYAETEMWWSALPVIGRSRGRWVFVEPALSLIHISEPTRPY